jgi:hypothetical protein
MPEDDLNKDGDVSDERTTQDAPTLVEGQVESTQERFLGRVPYFSLRDLYQRV